MWVCGAFFYGTEFLTKEEVRAIPGVMLAAQLGYYPNAELESQSVEQEPRYVPRDMAIDAGDVSLEGSPY